MQQQYSDNPLDKQFRDKLSGTSVQPRKRVWNRIAGNLEKANHRKAVIGRKILYISMASVAAAAITATLFFVPSITRQTTVSNHTTAQVTKQIEHVKEIANEAPKASAIQNTSSTTASSESTASTSHLSTSLAKNNPTSVKNQLTKLNSNVHATLSILNNALGQVNNTPSNTINQKEDILPLVSVAKGVDIPSVEPPLLTEVAAYADNYNNLAINELTPSEKVKIQTTDICVKGLYIGADAALNNTWLMDKKALYNYDFKYNFTVGRTIAVKAGYNFSNFFGIETGCNIIAEEGQDYTFNPPVFARVEPSNLDNRVKLTYTQIPLLAKFKFVKTSGLTHHTVALNISAGAQYGILHSISNTVSDENAEYANFKKNELAVVGGVGYDVYVSPKVFISTGVQFSYSSSLYNNTTVPASSFYSGQTSSYDQFSAPHSLVGGIYLGINYSITGCR